MVKKNRWARLRERENVRQYKWEFLRRNEEYKKEYLEFARRFPEWISEHGGIVPRPPSEDPEVLSYFKQQVEPAIEQITKRWCIWDPYDPSLSSDPAQSTTWMVTPSFCSPDQLKDGAAPELFQPTVVDCSPASFRSISRDGIHRPFDYRFVKFQIDIARPLESIFNELEIEIEIAKSWYRFHIGEFPEFRKRSRSRLNEYDSYLAVWDLRAQGYTFEQIASHLFPNQMKKSTSRTAAMKRVRSHFQRAQRLISGEYRQIES